MTADAAPATVAAYGAWNPGIQSDVPWPLLPLSTIFRPENVLTGLDHVHELSDVAGLSVDDLVVFRPERLVVHELLIRVMADFSVPDGPRQEDLGIEFRRMVHAILTRYVEPHRPEIVAAYGTLHRSLAEFIDAELSRALAALSDSGAARAPRSDAGGLLAFFRRAERPVTPATNGTAKSGSCGTGRRARSPTRIRCAAPHAAHSCASPPRCARGTAGCGATSRC